jgi:hypothetical protein
MMSKEWTKTDAFAHFGAHGANPTVELVGAFSRRRERRAYIVAARIQHHKWCNDIHTALKR